MRFKTDEVHKRWEEWTSHPKLQLLLMDVINICGEMYQIQPLMTESGRTREEQIAIYGDEHAPISTHETRPLRAFDLRSSDFTPEQIDELVRTVNIHWVYDPARTDKHCAQCHEVNGHGMHLHFQVCDATKQRGIPEGA